ncbi:MAG TPA: hypothetical protein VIF62_17520, partial [Labilithrix sp.]
MDRFVAKVVDALAARDSCRTPLEPVRVARAIRGFVVDEHELAVYLDMSALDCGIVNEDFSFAWTDLDSILDPTGPHARLAARPATVR